MVLMDMYVHIEMRLRKFRLLTRSWDEVIEKIRRRTQFGQKGERGRVFGPSSLIRNEVSETLNEKVGL